MEEVQRDLIDYLFFFSLQKLNPTLIGRLLKAESLFQLTPSLELILLQELKFLIFFLILNPEVED